MISKTEYDETNNTNAEAPYTGGLRIVGMAENSP